MVSPIHTALDIFEDDIDQRYEPLETRLTEITDHSKRAATPKLIGFHLATEDGIERRINLEESPTRYESLPCSSTAKKRWREPWMGAR